jgi:hypothetical protein
MLARRCSPCFVTSRTFPNECRLKQAAFHVGAPLFVMFCYQPDIPP